MKTFSHGGDLGDCLYTIPAITQLLNGQRCELVLYPNEAVREPWTREKVDRVSSFFASQSWCVGARYAANAEGFNLDVWRVRTKFDKNLIDCISDNLICRRHDVATPWITAEPTPIADVVFHRSARYQDAKFPWGWQIDTYGSRAVFVGSPEEYSDFILEHGGLWSHVPYYHTPTLKHLAEVIAGAKLFIGNQSAPLAVAHGLCQNVWVELPGFPQNTIHKRANAWYGTEEGKYVKLRGEPDFDFTRPHFKTRGPCAPGCCATG